MELFKLGKDVIVSHIYIFKAHERKPNSITGHDDQAFPYRKMLVQHVKDGGADWRVTTWWDQSKAKDLNAIGPPL